MEIKIKDQDKLIDAILEVVDGVMIVSPKVEKFEPKDGDVVSSPNGRELFIFKGNQKGIYGECYCGYSLIKDCLFKAGIWHIVRFATEAEKKMLFDKLESEGYEWLPEKKKLVKKKWKPADREKVYVAGFTFYGKCPFFPFEDKAYADSMQWRAVFERGWYFKTEEECQNFCDKLNQTIESIKP